MIVAQSRLSYSALGHGSPVGHDLAAQGRKHARLHQRGFANARIADQRHNAVHMRSQQVQRLRGLLLAAEEEVGVFLAQAFEAAIGVNAQPGLLFIRGRGLAVEGGHDCGQMRLAGRVRRFDVMERRQKGQRRHIVRHQYRHELELGLHDGAVVRGVIFRQLPAAGLGAQQDDEGVRGGDARRQLRLPGRAIAQIPVGGEDLAACELGFDRVFSASAMRLSGVW